jgi:hypothetical protein
LIPVFDRTGRANTGHSLETVVLVELERRRLEVTYVRTEQGREVDFLVRHPDGQAELIQVCSDATDPDTAGRELRALVEAGRFYKKANKRMLTLTRDSMIRGAPDDIVVQPAYEWILSGPATKK